MKRLIGIAVLVAVALASGACAPMLAGPMGGMYGRPMFGAPRPPAYVAEPNLNRWDQVMSLGTNWVIEILAADGTTHQGRFVRASVKTLHFVTHEGPQELSKGDVIRVDLLDAQGGADTGKDVAVGAVTGAAATGGSLMLIPFLLTGKVVAPRARLWAFGAAVGAVGAVQRDRHDRRPRTVYVASIRD